MDNSNHLFGMTPTEIIDLGNLPLGQEFFILLKNGLDRLETGNIIEVRSMLSDIKDDVSSWCKMRGNTLLITMDAGNHYRYLIKKTNNIEQEQPDRGIKIPTRKGSYLDIRDWFEGRLGNLLDEAPSYIGFVPRGAVSEPGIPDFGFTINRKDDVWADNLLILYEQAKEQQWNATTDIDWDQLPELPEELEKAICQIMTFLAENEYSALYIPAKFMSKINPHYIEVLLYLSTLVNDEARHIEAFMKRAVANGGGLQYSSLLTERSLLSLFIQEDYFKSSFLLHVLGEGTFLDLLTYIEEHAPDPVTKKIVQLAKIDEGRHVSYGIGHVRHMLNSNPQMVKFLLEAAEERNQYLSKSGTHENTHVMEALAIIGGGGRKPEQLQHGFSLVNKLKDVMYQHRIQRMLQIGIDIETAKKISASHTPNFM